MQQDYFAKVLSACPRRARETLYMRFAIPKAKKKASALLPGKDPARIRKLQVAMSAAADDDEQAQQLAEELIRVYLMTRRSLLGDALDAIGVEHDDGLTDADLDEFSSLDSEEASELIARLSVTHDADDVALYLRYMGAELEV